MVNRSTLQPVNFVRASSADTKGQYKAFLEVQGYHIIINLDSFSRPVHSKNTKWKYESVFTYGFIYDIIMTAKSFVFWLYKCV